MTIKEVYKKYQIPPNLEKHMLTVAAIVEHFLDHWQGPEIHRGRAVRAALLHDMGNIVKFKRPFLGELEKDAEKWEQVQEEFKQQYGTNAFIATIEIVKELEVHEWIPEILREMKYMLENEDMSYRPETRLVEFVDCLVSPQGIVGFEERMKDLGERYEKRDRAWQKPFRSNAQIVRSWVNINLDTLPKDFGDKQAEKQFERLLEFRVVEE